MRVALYARYSSEGQREASITDQFRNCEQYAARESWQIVERYQDKAMSGSTSDRPGYQQMLREARAKQFDALMVDDLSRLSRDSKETEEVRRLFVFLRIRLIGVSDGIDTSRKGHKASFGFKGLMNDIHNDDLAEKTHRGITRQALGGYHTGGRTYGYRHVRETDPIQKDRYGEPALIGVKRVIDEDQANVIRQIFTWYADGQSPRWIVGELNRLGVPAPGAAYKRKERTSLSGTWSPSALHGDVKHARGILNNPIYVGTVIWNRRQWVKNPDNENKRCPQVRPENEWQKRDEPDLRIIDQKLWDRVQARRKSRPKMKPRTPVINGKYLLSGLLVCGKCGRRFVMADAYRYGCAGHINRRGCANDLRVRRELVEARCLDGLRQELFTPERFALFVQELTRELAARQRQQRPDNGRTQKELAAVDAEITHLVNAIKQGIVTVSTKAELERLEAKREQLKDRMQDGAQRFDNVMALLPRAKERYDAIVSRFAPSPRHIEPMREQIKNLVGEITLRPTAEGYLEAELIGRYEGLMKLAVGRNAFGCGGRI